MKPILSCVLVAAHMAALLGTVPAVSAGAAAGDPADKQNLDQRLRAAGVARVSYLRRESPGGQVLDQPNLLLVRSPRAAVDGLHFTSVARPESLDLGTTSFTWELVNRIQVRTSHARAGAGVGAVVVATFAVAAEHVGSQLGISPTHEAHYLQAIAIGAIVGTVLGAAIGSGSRSWETVYP